jgi:hypothetical protein
MGASVRAAVAALLAGGLLVAPTMAQEDGTGTVVGRVMWCDAETATEVPASNTLVVAEGTFAGTRTDDNGEFTLHDVPAQPGQIIEALSDDEQVTASRPNVPVAADRTLDIGVLELGAPSLTGCIPEPVQPEDISL